MHARPPTKTVDRLTAQGGAVVIIARRPRWWRSHTYWCTGAHFVPSVIAWYGKREARRLAEHHADTCWAEPTSWADPS